MFLKSLSYLFLLTFLSLNIVHLFSELAPLTIHINDGMIEGQYASGVRMFRKIPYAAPPIESYRWGPPESPEPWGSNTLMCQMDPPGCPQVCLLPPHGCPTYTSEDCLYLNVFTPSELNSSNPYPVMVFIHGGNFFQGYSGGPLYNGSYIVLTSNVILVSINYRLGALGFLWSPTGPSGNYGMMDQRLALEWVRDNIAYFGGDPNRITIFGQSAGAMSVGLHMVESYWNGASTNKDKKQKKIESSNTNGLFQAAIMESNPFGLPFRDTGSWGTLPRRFYDLIGCNYDKFGHNEEQFWTCLRNVSTDTIVQAQWTAQNEVGDEADHFWDIFLPWSPTCGTDLFPTQGFFEFQQGNYVDIPYIIGVVLNEGVEFVYAAFPSPLGRAELEGVMVALMGQSDTNLILQQYPLPPNTTDYRNYASEVATDALFRCPTRNTSLVHAQMYNENQKVEPAYMYHFNHVSSFNSHLWGPNFTYCWDVVCHSAELPYVFHPGAGVDNTSYDEMEQYLSLNIMDYWTTFAGSLNTPGKGNNYVPANASGTEWLMFETGQEGCMLFNTGNLQMVNNYDTSICEFWDTLNYNWIK